MTSDQDQPRFERWKRAVLDHRWLALIAFLGAVVIAVASFTDALVKIGNFLGILEPASGSVTIDAVTKVHPSETAGLIAFDVTVRNTTISPVAITKAQFSFDEHLGGELQSVQYVSGVYLVDVGDSEASVEGPTGRHHASAYYPNADGLTLSVSAPLSQTIAPNAVDRFRIVFGGRDLRGPMERVSVRLTYDGTKTVTVEDVDLPPRSGWQFP